MKTEWICTWQLIPGRQEQVDIFPTRKAANQAMSKILREAVDLESYIRDLRREEGEDCAPSADYLEHFLQTLELPATPEDVPAHWDIPDHCDLSFYETEGFRWGYMRRECPLLVVRDAFVGQQEWPFIVDFGFESPDRISRDRVNAVYIQIEERVNYGTSAYPLMLLSELCDIPQTQEQLIRLIKHRFNIHIDRKAIGRHLTLLEELGFGIVHTGKGYRLSGMQTPPVTGKKYGASAYPLMIWKVLAETPQTQEAIIQAVQSTFGVKMERKAVGRHLKTMTALSFPIRKTKKGYQRW